MGLFNGKKRELELKQEEARAQYILRAVEQLTEAVAELTERLALNAAITEETIRALKENTELRNSIAALGVALEENTSALRANTQMLLGSYYRDYEKEHGATDAEITYEDAPAEITIAQAAQISGLSRETIYSWYYTDKVKGSLEKKGMPGRGKVYLDKQSFLEALKERKGK